MGEIEQEGGENSGQWLKKSWEVLADKEDNFLGIR